MFAFDGRPLTSANVLSVALKHDDVDAALESVRWPGGVAVLVDKRAIPRATVSWIALPRSKAAAACDFFTVDTAVGRRLYLLFFTANLTGADGHEILPVGGHG